MILITGGLGFLGSGLARYLLDQGEQVVLTRRRNARIPPMLANDLDKKLKVVYCDILDLPSLVSVVKKYEVTRSNATNLCPPVLPCEENRIDSYTIRRERTGTQG